MGCLRVHGLNDY
jgi:vesicle coat complex subunit